MAKNKKISIAAGLICLLILGICSSPYLPLSQERYLNSFEKIVRLGPYEIKPRILLSANSDNTDMKISGYFSYPAKKMIEDGCVFEVSIDIEGRTRQKYPDHVVGTEYEKNFPTENVTDSSIDDPIDSEKSRRLFLILYNEPIVEQIYTLSLKSKSPKNIDICQGIKIIRHPIRYHRASAWDYAMGV